MMITTPTAVSGLVPSLKSLPNITSHVLMMPLKIDDTLVFTDAVEESAPRGVIMNAGVGSLVFAGGLMGFVKAGSRASLIAGSMFGGLLMVSSYLIKTKKQIGNILGSGVSAMLSYTMGKKFLNSKKFIPSGLIACMSSISAIYNIISLYQTNNSGNKEGDKQEPKMSSSTTKTAGTTTAPANDDNQVGSDDESSSSTAETQEE